MYVQIGYDGYQQGHYMLGRNNTFYKNNQQVSATGNPSSGTTETGTLSPR
jgi:hypothetical protein